MIFLKEINNPPCIKTLARIILTWETNRIEVLKMENTAELLKVLHHDEKIDNVCGDENRKDSLVNNKKGKGVFYAVINYNPCHGHPHLGNRIRNNLTGLKMNHKDKKTTRKKLQRSNHILYIFFTLYIPKF